MYNPRTEPNDTITDIYYVNSYPGAGKTHRALRIAATTLNTGESCGHILVYAAPTELLLQQFYDDLSKTVKSLRQMKNVHIVSSRSSKTTVANHFEGLLNSKQVGSTVINKVSNGSVILCTHACIQSIRSTMPGKDRVSLIFDEARQCVQREFKVTVPLRVMEAVKSDSVYVHDAVTSTSIARWSWIPDARPFTETQIKTLWGKKPAKGAMERFMSFLEHIRNGAMHVWVSRDEHTRDAEEVGVNVILSPERLFYGYGKVLILSAFFEHSQMFHLLKRKEVDLSTRVGRSRYLLLERQDRVKLHNVTDALIDGKRVTQIKHGRLSKAVMTYVLEHESLSKYHIQRGIVIPRAKHKQMKKFNQKYYDLFSNESNGVKVPETYRKMFDLMNHERTSFRSDVLPRVELIESMKPIKLSVVQYLVAASSKIQRAWLADNGMKKEPMLVCINAREHVSSHQSLYAQERIDELLNKKEPKVVRVPVMSQGLNDWASHHTAAFLATVKLSSQQIKFLQQIIPGYDPDLDRTVDQCIQFIFRSSIRKAESASRCLLIVSDRKLAESVNKTLGSPLEILAPSELVDDWRPYGIAVYAGVEEAESKSARNRAYRTSEGGREVYREHDRKRSGDEYRKAYVRISVAISRMRTKAAADSSLKPKLDALIAERAALSK